MTGGAYELLTVSGAAAALMKSEGGVRRLIKAGKLKPLREGRRVLLTPEELERYARTLPHPVWVMAAQQHSRDILSMQSTLAGLYGASMRYLAPGLAATYRHFLPLAVPVCRELLEAVKAGNYTQVREHDQELARIQTDYQILHAPIKTLPYSPTPTKARPAAVQLALFPTDGGGTV